MTARTLAALIGIALSFPAAVAASSCPSDCDGNGRVLISELMLAVSIAQDVFPLRGCPQADTNADARVGVADLVASVAAALTGCPPPLPTSTAVASPTSTATRTSTSVPTATVTSTATATPVFDPQLPPTDTVELLKWLEQGQYRQWRQVRWNGGQPHRRDGTPTFVDTFINEALYASLVCYDAPNHPLGASAVMEVWTDPDQEEPFGWSVSQKIAPASDGGRGWFWYDYFGESVRSAGRGVVECASCHESGFGYALDYYLTLDWHGGLTSCNRIPESDGGVCTALGLPALAIAYDGQIETAGGSISPATLYRALSGGFQLQGSFFYSTSSGEFRVFCGGSVPYPIRAEVDETPDGELGFAYYDLPSDTLVLRFRGRRR